MKKSKKLLLAGISAMSLVAVATGAVSTFAWFQASASATMTTTGHADERSVAVTSSPRSLGTFTITPVLGTISNTISLTDDDGNTWVYNEGDSSTPLPATGTNLHATIDVDYHITYDGTLTNLDDVKAAWTSYWDTTGSAGLTLTIADNSGDAYEALTESTTPKKSEVDKVASGEGLKLKKTAFGTAGVANSYVGESSVNWTIGASTLKALASSFTKPSSTIVCPADQDVGTLYVAIKGIAAVQDGDTYYAVDAHF